MTSETTRAVTTNECARQGPGPTSDSKEKANESPTSLIQNFDEAVSGIDIPVFLCEHKATLRFPEMVSFRECVAYRTGLSWNHSLQAILTKNC